MTKDSQSLCKKTKWCQHYTVRLVLFNFWHCNIMLFTTKVPGLIHAYWWADMHHKQLVANTQYKSFTSFHSPNMKKPWKFSHILESFHIYIHSVFFFLLKYVLSTEVWCHTTGIALTFLQSVAFSECETEWGSSSCICSCLSYSCSRSHCCHPQYTSVKI